MELKVACDCGQNYKFDVEPVGGRMPFTVNCPGCNADGTATANTLIAEQMASLPSLPIAPPPIEPAAGLRINRTEHAAPVLSVSAPPPLMAANIPTAVKVQTQDFSLVRGIAGGVAGALVGCGLMFAFWLWAHFRLPFMGVAIGAAAGYPARWLARGTDNTLAVIVAAVAGALVTGTFVLMYGEFVVVNIISIVLCCVVAYRVTSD